MDQPSVYQKYSPGLDLGTWQRPRGGLNLNTEIEWKYSPSSPSEVDHRLEIVTTFGFTRKS
jgi:hypothetical protein